MDIDNQINLILYRMFLHSKVADNVGEERGGDVADLANAADGAVQHLAKVVVHSAEETVNATQTLVQAAAAATSEQAANTGGQSFASTSIFITIFRGLSAEEQEIVLAELLRSRK
jgi:hypothetical protein